jgi:hypothetical protein
MEWPVLQLCRLHGAGGLRVKLTLAKRIKLAFEALTTTSGHNHSSDEKQLSTFQRGYDAGMKDARLMQKQNEEGQSWKS